MRSTVIVTGASGFVGRAVLGCSHRRPDCTMMAVAREAAIAAVERAGRDHPDRALKVLNLAWPTMRAYASDRRSTSVDAGEWGSYRAWLAKLAAATAGVAGARFFGVGSGIEPYALDEQLALGEPYVTYAQHKREIRQVLAGTSDLDVSWLRLHFLFGPHEAPSRIIPGVLRACRDGTPVEIDAVERRRHWLHVEDAAWGLVQAVLSEAPEDWDIVGETAVSFREMIDLVEIVVGRALLLCPSKKPTADRQCLYVAPTKRPSFMRSSIGSTNGLLIRLNDYMNWINRHDD